jgi:bifunctional ADP-heptose synthase (sugar kinase/adenylyltransferase)
MFWSDESGNGHIPARKCSVKDVCGAGDTVLAVIGHYFFDKRLSTICQIAARVAEEQISHIGVNNFEKFA